MFAVPRSQVRSALRSLACVSAVAGIAILSACSSTTTVDEPAHLPAPCLDVNCAPGNKCLPLDGEIKCRKVCSSNTDPASSCPFGYTCTDPLTGDEPFCVHDQALRDDGAPIEKKPSGQWGSKCQANLGLNDPACDNEQGFYCYAPTPTDGDAYCTRYKCEADAECGAGFWCATVNKTPNIVTAKRAGFGETLRVCLRRTYCATCAADVDCPDVAGRKQHCVGDAAGGSFCAPECQTTSNCANEAVCVDAGVGANVCYPRARVCVGDGSLCSPCRSDADCGEDGACVKGTYTTERACAKKAPSGDCSSCPKSAGGAQQIGCTREDSELAPKSYCVGLYDLGKEVTDQDGKPYQPTDVGCWTPKRKEK